MSGTDLCVNKCKQSRTYLNHLVYTHTHTKHIRILKIQLYNTLLIFLLYTFPDGISRTFHRQTMQQSKLGHFSTSELTQAIILTKVCKNALYHNSSTETIHS